MACSHTSQYKNGVFRNADESANRNSDIAAISEIAHSANPDIKVVVDNTFCTPVLQRPLEFGADVIMHSATKFIDGQGRCVGGAVVGDADFVGEKVFSFIKFSFGISIEFSFLIGFSRAGKYQNNLFFIVK